MGPMTGGILTSLPARRGHFLLESGYHSGVWFMLDELFTDPGMVAPLVAILADRLRPYAVTAVCGPLLGGAFLAQALATTLGSRFYYTEPTAPREAGLFTAEYHLPLVLRQQVRGQTIAVVDDAMSAGSSVRATVAALASAGASTAVVGTFLVLGDAGLTHLADRRVPVEAVERRGFDLWKPDECPLCQSGPPLEDPR